jgi:hypothetical protein
MIITTILSAALALAAPATTTAEIDMCASASETAKILMEIRQAGKYPLPAVIKNLRETTSDHPEAFQIFTRMARDAYDSPRYATREYRQQAINEFENKYMVACLRDPNNFR